MGDLDAAFEQHLANMSDGDWSALVARVRPPTAPQRPLTNEQILGEHAFGGEATSAGLSEAKRRGYINDGKQGKR
jgi:hypothetical protein